MVCIYEHTFKTYAWNVSTTEKTFFEIVCIYLNIWRQGRVLTTALSEMVSAMLAMAWFERVSGMKIKYWRRLN